MSEPPRAAGEWEAPTIAQSAVVELVLGAVGLGLIVVSGHSFESAFVAPVQPLVALGGGVVLGGFIALIAGWLVRRPAVAAGFAPFLSRFTGSAPTPANAVLLGIVAALGEETLFRAAIQPMAGLVIAAIFFTAAHSLIGDFRHLSFEKVAYIVFALMIGLLLGLLYERFGIAASMGLHAAFDAVFLLGIRSFLVQPPAESAALGPVA